MTEPETIHIYLSGNEDDVARAKTQLLLLKSLSHDTMVEFHSTSLEQLQELSEFLEMLGTITIGKQSD